MKILGVLSILLALTNAVVAEEQTKAKESRQQAMTLAMNDYQAVQPLALIEHKPFVANQALDLSEVNAKLEEKLAQKLNSQVADQLKVLAQ